MAHIVASITVFVNVPPLYLLRRYAIAKRKIAPMFLSLSSARMAVNRSVVFPVSSEVPSPIRDRLHLIRE